LLGFESQGFVDAWAPIFFFALVFALATDDTVFLLATTKEAHQRTGDARDAVIEGLAVTGRVINAAAAVGERPRAEIPARWSSRAAFMTPRGPWTTRDPVDCGPRG
jgi:hypothetical protein